MASATNFGSARDAGVREEKSSAADRKQFAPLRFIGKEIGHSCVGEIYRGRALVAPEFASRSASRVLTLNSRWTIFLPVCGSISTASASRKLGRLGRLGRKPADAQSRDDHENSEVRDEDAHRDAEQQLGVHRRRVFRLLDQLPEFLLLQVVRPPRSSAVLCEKENRGWCSCEGRDGR